MKVSTIIPFTTLVGSSLAWFEPRGHEYHPASPWDSRSPCPGLNALANHGYLPRDGKDIDHQKVSYATHTAYNFEPGSFDAIVDLVFQFGLSTSSRPNETFHLLDLAQHDFIETDGSLTRNDIFFGDDVHFDPKVWAPYAKDLGLSHYRFTDRFVTVDKAAAATKNRLELAKAVNPRFNASAFQQMAEYGTTGLYLLTMWDDDHEAAPKPWVKSLLSEDRIPFREGFKTPKKAKNNDRLVNMTLAVRKAAGLPVQ